MDNQALRKKLLESWEITSTEDAANAYSSILDHIFSEPCRNMEHMPFSSFTRIVNNPDIGHETLVKLVFHLINIAELLDLKYEFIDDEESCYQTPIEIIKESHKTGFFGHPETGESVNAYEDKVFMYFTPSRRLRHLKNNSDQEEFVK
jgi:hypothetical protein